MKGAHPTLTPENFALCVPEKSGSLDVRCHSERSLALLLDTSCYFLATTDLPLFSWTRWTYTVVPVKRPSCCWSLDHQWFISKRGCSLHLSRNPSNCFVFRHWHIVVPGNFVQWLWFCRKPGENQHEWESLCLIFQAVGGEKQVGAAASLCIS